MPQADSLRLTTDTATILSDSIQKSDSLAAIDSTALVDSLKIHIIRGFEGIPHPSLPSSESWVFGTFLILFVILLISAMRGSDWITESIRTFFQVKERSSIFSKTTMNNFQSRLLLTIFSTGIFSLYAYYLYFDPKSGFHISTYMSFCLATSAFLLFKLLFFQLIGYVFLDNTLLKLARESYFNVMYYLGIVLFPLLIFQIYFPTNLNHSTGIASLIICTIAAILVIIKLFQIFFRKIVASFYILLYLCTLEILPLIILFWAFRMIV